ncbi:MAG: hypothetical protein Q4F95_02050 [Oscillospiraceae bacterium]|nr:hypothetical protein [Oscillospiraceae bacterium]
MVTYNTLDECGNIVQKIKPVTYKHSCFLLPDGYNYCAVDNGNRITLPFFMTDSTMKDYDVYLKENEKTKIYIDFHKKTKEHEKFDGRVWLPKVIARRFRLQFLDLLKIEPTASGFILTYTGKNLDDYEFEEGGPFEHKE